MKRGTLWFHVDGAGLCYVWPLHGCVELGVRREPGGSMHVTRLRHPEEVRDRWPQLREALGHHVALLEAGAAWEDAAPARLAVRR